MSIPSGSRDEGLYDEAMRMNLLDIQSLSICERVLTQSNVLQRYIRRSGSYANTRLTWRSRLEVPTSALGVD